MAKIVAVDGQTVITDEQITKDTGRKDENGKAITITEPNRIEFARKGLLDSGKKDEMGRVAYETIHLSEVLPGDEIKSPGPDKFVVVRK